MARPPTLSFDRGTLLLHPSGTGSRREYVQRLGRILRRREGKRAVLYEVVAEATGEERVSRRRRQGPRVSAARQRDGRAPDVCAGDGDDELLAPQPQHGQEDDRSYPPSC